MLSQGGVEDTSRVSLSGGWDNRARGILGSEVLALPNKAQIEALIRSASRNPQKQGPSLPLPMNQPGDHQHASDDEKGGSYTGFSLLDSDLETGNVAGAHRMEADADEFDLQGMPMEGQSGGTLGGFQCFQCGHVFYRKHDMKRHVRTIHQKTQFACHMCPKICSRRDNLYQHLKNKHNIDRRKK